jgi:hypothetical protein
MRNQLLVLCFAFVGVAAAEIPRLPDGKPDLNGVWQVLNTANANVEAHNAQAAYALVDGPFGPIPAPEVVAMGAVGAVPGGAGVVVGGVLPYRPEALAVRDANRRAWLERDPEIRCYLPGIPRANYMPYPFQIVQSGQALMFAYEYAGAVRNVYLEDPGEAPIDSWMGQSYGQWDGDTLVIEVTAQNDRTWFDRAGNHHSAAMVVTERFTPVNAHVLMYEATIDDPQTFTGPWTMRMPLYRRYGADAQLGQFNCVPFVEQLLYGHLRKADAGASEEGAR